MENMGEVDNSLFFRCPAFWNPIKTCTRENQQKGIRSTLLETFTSTSYFELSAAASHALISIKTKDLSEMFRTRNWYIYGGILFR